jgi:uncharacterized membrane protein YkoI
MNQKTALAIASALTAFVLVVGGAVAGRIAQPATVATTPTVAEIQALITQREADYQARLNEANQALTQAYAPQSVAAPSNVAAPAAASEPQGSTTSQVKFTPEQAATTAIAALPGAKLMRTPELVNFQSSVAYEVRLSQGLVYVDANTGKILYNSALDQNVTASNPSPNPSGEHEGEAGTQHESESRHETEHETESHGD